MRARRELAGRQKALHIYRTRYVSVAPPRKFSPCRGFLAPPAAPRRPFDAPDRFAVFRLAAAFFFPRASAQRFRRREDRRGGLESGSSWMRIGTCFECEIWAEWWKLGVPCGWISRRVVNWVYLGSLQSISWRRGFVNFDEKATGWGSDESQRKCKFIVRFVILHHGGNANSLYVLWCYNTLALDNCSTLFLLRLMMRF